MSEITGSDLGLTSGPIQRTCISAGIDYPLPKRAVEKIKKEEVKT
jgi:hypothetical protein